MQLERGDRSTEKKVGKLNSQVLQISKEVHDALKGTANNASIDKVLSTAFILGNEDKRSDMNMLSSLQGMLDGMQILKKDPSLALQADAINSVMARDKQKREFEYAALSL